MNEFRPLFTALVLIFVITTSCHNKKKETFFSYVEGKTGITGGAYQDGTPIENVEVYLYRNLKTNFRGPADFLDVTDVNGRYFLDVPEGKYYIIARKRKKGVGSGPIKKGDYYSEPKYEPVIVKSGQTAVVDLELKQLFGKLIQKKSGQEKTETHLSGTISDKSGIPVKGVYAFAYGDEDFKREPDFFSAETGDDGTFTIYFKEGGRYYIGAKSPGRGGLKKGDLYGLYKGVRGSSIYIKSKEGLSGIKIIVENYK